MSQAQRKSERSAQVRSVPPPLPRRSHGGPALESSIRSLKPRVTPPPPPPEALRSSRPPRLVMPAPAPEQPAVQLALLPQWDDMNAPLRPAPKRSKGILYWVGSASVSIAVGALVAASLMSIRPGDIAQILPSRSESRVEQPKITQAHVEVHEAELLPEVEEVIAPAQPVLIEQLTVTSDRRAMKAANAKPAKRAKPAARAARRSAPVLTLSQPDPREEVAAESSNEVTEPVAVQPEEVAAITEPTTEAPEVSEPEAPALPEKLTRDQVRSGLDALRSQVLACANGSYGRVLADVTISAPGRVSHAVIEGTFAGTNAGSCMARALRGGAFPAFSGPDISVRYPFSF